MKKALVTGATGFIGSHLVRYLLDEGWAVDVVVRPTSNLAMLNEVENKIGIHEHGGDTESLIAIMSKSKPGVVFHLASLFLSEHKPEQVAGLIQSNVLFGSQLLEAMAQADVHCLVNTSTYWEHYQNREYSPVNLYAATKKAFQDILQFYVEARGIRAITLKLYDTYGPDDPRPKLLNLLLKAAETGEELALSPGEQKIDLVHVDDVASAYLVAAQRLSYGLVDSHEQYGVYSGNPMSIKDLVEFVKRETGHKLKVRWGGRPYRDREVMCPYYGLDQLLGWYPSLESLRI